MPNFDAIADQVMETVERPPLAPLGDYVFVITALPTRRDVSSDKGSWEALEFPLQAVQPGQDVDPDLVKSYGDLKNIRVRKTFMFTKDEGDKAGFQTTLANLKDFLTKHLGLPDNMSIKEGINASVGQKCVGELRYRADPNNKETQYHEIGRTAPVA